VSELSEAELDALIAQATVDCYNQDEELAGFAAMIEDNLAVPFETTVLGVTVTVRKKSQTESGIVAICVHWKDRQAIPILDLPLPDLPPRASNGSPPTAAGQDRRRRHQRVPVLRVPRAGPAADRETTCRATVALHLRGDNRDEVVNPTA
jgi:hypothetical protein